MVRSVTFAFEFVTDHSLIMIDILYWAILAGAV